ncbi:MAG: ParB/RepB/Spo0J family partition protein [Oscillospiraceae bacterium]|nr:ParB/RepB/Spo0J family partition protein [Oscillospiraceae bacterium]
MALERGLGKGLDALLGDTSLQEQEATSLSLPISQVEPGLRQPRKQFDEDALHDLADSIREHGILQPLTVRRLSSGYYQIVAGERRWRAAKLAGLSQVPVNIIEADDRKVMELGLIENLQREDLNPIEEANGYLTLKDEFGLTQEEIAQRMGKSRSAIANALRLTGLPELVRDMVLEGELSAGHARALLALPQAELQEKAAQQVISLDLNVRQTEALVKKLQAGESTLSKAEKKNDDDQRIYLEELEKSLSSRWGRKVSISPGKKKGKIQLEYYDTEDLEHLLSLLQAIDGKGG